MYTKGYCETLQLDISLVWGERRIEEGISEVKFYLDPMV